MIFKCFNDIFNPLSDKLLRSKADGANHSSVPDKKDGYYSSNKFVFETKSIRVGWVGPLHCTVTIVLMNRVRFCCFLTFCNGKSLDWDRLGVAQID